MAVKRLDMGYGRSATEALRDPLIARALNGDSVKCKSGSVRQTNRTFFSWNGKSVQAGTFGGVLRWLLGLASFIFL
jgi:hypothetical protein